MKATQIPLELTAYMEQTILRALYPYRPTHAQLDIMYAAMITVGLRTSYEVPSTKDQE